MSTIAPQVTTSTPRYLFAQSPAIRARAIFPIYAKTTVALVRAAYHHAPMKIRSKFLRSSWQCTWRCKNVWCKSSAFSSHSADHHRPNFHIWHIYIGCYLALGLGLGAGTFALSDDDHRSVRDARRVFAHRLKKSVRSQEHHLVYRVVEHGSRGDHGRSGPQRSGRARSFGGRCARAHSRCHHACSVDAARTACDPVKHGLVASFNRPGGNVTVVSPNSTALGAKRLGLLHDLVPGAALIGHLVNPNSPDRDGQLRDAEEAARTLGWQIHVVYAGTEGDIDAGFASLVRQKAGALLVSSDPFFDTRRDQIVAL